MDVQVSQIIAIMKALKKVEFDGVLIADHIPDMASGPNTGTAFSIGYLTSSIT